MKLLIAITSCQRDLAIGCHDAIRASWGRVAVSLGIDVRFFVGGEDVSNSLRPDEVWVPVRDSYYNLPHKTKAAVQWFLAQEHSHLFKKYTHFFKADNDTFVHPQRLLDCGFEDADYYGTPVSNIYMNGGPGYFLNRKAAEIIAASEVGSNTAEDFWVGTMLTNVVRKDGGEKFWRFASWHFPAGAYDGKRYHPDSKWQQTMARAHLGSIDGLDPRGLCFQDRAENGIMNGYVKVLMKFPGHPDRVRTLSQKEFLFWKGQGFIKEILSPRW